MAWVLGRRDTATFRRLYDKVKHLTDCIFYTDNWDAFAEVLPPERHVIGKAHTIDISMITAIRDTIWADLRGAPRLYPISNIWLT